MVQRMETHSLYVGKTAWFLSKPATYQRSNQKYAPLCNRARQVERAPETAVGDSSLCSLLTSQAEMWLSLFANRVVVAKVPHLLAVSNYSRQRRTR